MEVRGLEPLTSTLRTVNMVRCRLRLWAHLIRDQEFYATPQYTTRQRESHSRGPGVVRDQLPKVSSRLLPDGRNQHGSVEPSTVRHRPASW